MKWILSIHCSVSQQVLQSLMVSLVLMCLDYGNTKLAGVANTQLWWTNVGAWDVCSAWKSDHITPLLCDLHWLWVMQWTEFKLAVLVFHCQHGMSPLCLTRRPNLRYVADMDSMVTPFWFSAQAGHSTNALHHHRWPRLCSCCSTYRTICRLTSSHHHRSMSSNNGWRHYSSAIHLMSDYHLHDTVDFTFCFVKCSRSFFWLYGTLIILMCNNNDDDDVELKQKLINT